MRIDPDLKEAAARCAAADRRSLSGLIEKLLADYVAAHDSKKPTPKGGRKS